MGQPASSALKLITAQAVVSPVASVDFTSGITALYRHYILTFSNVVFATNLVDFWLRTSANAGTSFDTGASDYEHERLNIPGAASGVNADTKILIVGNGYGLNVGTYGGLNGTINLFDLAGTVGQKHCLFDASALFDNAAGDMLRITGMGVRVAAPAVNGLRLMASSGNIASGQFNLYGVAKS